MPRRSGWQNASPSAFVLSQELPLRTDPGRTLYPRRAHPRGVRALALRRLAPRARRAARAGFRRVRGRAQRARRPRRSRPGARDHDRVLAQPDGMERRLRARGPRAHRDGPRNDIPAILPGRPCPRSPRCRGARPVHEPALRQGAHSRRVVGGSLAASRGKEKFRLCKRSYSRRKTACSHSWLLPRLQSSSRM